MALEQTIVSQCLDKKMRIGGFEIVDLLAIFMTLSILNFVFGNTSLKFVFVWMPTVLVALTLYFGKKGKPENHLVHWLRFQFSPGVFKAFSESSENRSSLRAGQSLKTARSCNRTGSEVPNER